LNFWVLYTKSESQDRYIDLKFRFESKTLFIVPTDANCYKNHRNVKTILQYVEIKCQLDVTEVFIADLIACSTCFGILQTGSITLSSTPDQLL